MIHPLGSYSFCGKYLMEYKKIGRLMPSSTRKNTRLRSLHQMFRRVYTWYQSCRERSKFLIWIHHMQHISIKETLLKVRKIGTDLGLLIRRLCSNQRRIVRQQKKIFVLFLRHITVNMTAELSEQTYWMNERNLQSARKGYKQHLSYVIFLHAKYIPL